MSNVAADFVSGEGGDKEDDYHVNEKEQVEFFTALLKHRLEPIIFLVKGMEALKTAAKEPLYEDLKSLSVVPKGAQYCDLFFSY